MKRADLILWAILILVLAGSFTHTAWLFGLREQAGHGLWAWVLALGVDTGIAGSTYAIRLRRQADQRAGLLASVLVVCIVVSAFANFAHAVAVDAGHEPTLNDFAQVDALHLLTSALVSLPLPLLTLALAETVASDAAAAQEAAQAAHEKEETARKRAEAAQVTAAMRESVSHVAQTLGIDEQKARKVCRAQTLLSADPAPSLREVALSVSIPASTLRNYLARLDQPTADVEPAEVMPAQACATA